MLLRVLRKRAAQHLGNAVLVTFDDLHPVIRIQIGVEGVGVLLLKLLEDFFEMVVLDAQHDIAIHGKEAPVAIISKTPVLGPLGQGLDGRVVQTEIEHRIHHAGHRGPCPRADRDQQRIVGIAERLAGQGAHVIERPLDLSGKVGRIALIVGVKIGADLGRDGKAGRNREPEIGHFGEVRALATEQVAHVRGALGPAVAEGIDPFGHWSGSLGSRRAMYPAARLLLTGFVL